MRCLLEGEDYQESCAFPDFAGYLNPTVMFLGDPVGHGESQARAGSFSRIERTEDFGQMLGRNTTPCIDDGQSRHRLSEMKSQPE